jgi:predicted enzyme related to lactoylglutathione lyase
MKFKLSRCICLQHPAKDKIVEFYRKVFGLAVAEDKGDMAEIAGDPIRFFIDRAEPRELILEFVVDDLEAARDHLMAAGCRVIRWEGKGKTCYMRDPFGTLFNLWEENS